MAFTKPEEFLRQLNTPEGVDQLNNDIREKMQADHADMARRYLRNKFKDDPKVEEYIKEAEHQDGDGYWQQFDDPLGISVDEDFKMYCNYSEYRDDELESWSEHGLSQGGDRCLPRK